MGRYLDPWYDHEILALSRTHRSTHKLDRVMIRDCHDADAAINRRIDVAVQVRLRIGISVSVSMDVEIRAYKGRTGRPVVSIGLSHRILSCRYSAPGSLVPSRMYRNDRP